MSSHAASTSAGTRRIKLIKNPDFIHDGKMAYGHALRKFGFKPTLEYPFEVTDDIVHSGGVVHRMNERAHGRDTHVAQRRIMATDEHGQVGEVNAQDIQQDMQYLAPVCIGTPGAILQWTNLRQAVTNLPSQVWSTELPKSTLLQGKAIHHNIYDHTKSSTFKPSAGQKWQITYGDGSGASGNVGTDVLEIGGVHVQNQSIEMAQKMSSSFAQGYGDGLMGLAFASINTVIPTPAKTPVDNMIVQGAIKPSAELFTAYLGSYKDVNDPDKGQSFYTFGFIDEDTIKAANSDIWYAPVDDSNGFWQFKSTSYSVNGHVHHITGGTAIADTGTSIALISDSACRAIYAAIPGAKFSKAQGGYIYPTNTPQSSLPDVSFDIGGKMFCVQKEDLSYHDFPDGTSYGGIQSRGNLPFSIYGDTWLKSVYAIFDVGQKRFGCVQRIEPSNTNSNANVNAAQKMAQHDAAPTAQSPQPVPVPQPAAMAPVAPPSAPVAPVAAPTPATTAQPPASGAAAAPPSK